MYYNSVCVQQILQLCDWLLLYSWLISSSSFDLMSFSIMLATANSNDLINLLSLWINMDDHKPTCLSPKIIESWMCWDYLLALSSILLGNWVFTWVLFFPASPLLLEYETLN